MPLIGSGGTTIPTVEAILIGSRERTAEQDWCIRSANRIVNGVAVGVGNIALKPIVVTRSQIDEQSIVETISTGLKFILIEVANAVSL